MFNLIIVQDYYVKRFGFLFGGGRSGMHGLQALQGHGLVQVESSTLKYSITKSQTVQFSVYIF